MTAAFPLRDLPLVLAASEHASKQASLYDALRQAMTEGRLPPGSRLPASRDLAGQLGLARGTVVGVYDSLMAEGYLRSARGAGTFVAETLPDSWLTAKPRPAEKEHHPRAAVLSKRSEALVRSPFLALPLTPPRPFRPHTPAIEPALHAKWTALEARRARLCKLHDLRDVDARGYRPLRETLADYLRTSRGVRCEADQVVVVSGVNVALDVAVRLLLDAGDSAWMEDPGYFGARCILGAAGVTVTPVPVDAQGVDVARARALAPRARFAYVTPAHQAPLGSTLSDDRRAQLLEWADDAEAWIFEDDYDSEFRYEGRPLPALQGLDRRGMVIHAGTFSKTLFTGVRLAYVVLPASLVEPFSRALASVQRFVPLLPQAVLTDFIDGGDFGRHLRRMRGLYAERRASLVEGLSRELDGEVDVVGGAAGFEVVGLLRPSISDRVVNKLAKQEGVELMALSKYAVVPPVRDGLLLGFAAVPAAQTRRALPRLRRLLAEAAGTKR